MGIQTKNYAVEVQWGAGIRYFSAYTETLKEAQSLGTSMSKRLKIPARGALPTIRIWKRVGENVIRRTTKK